MATLVLILNQDIFEYDSNPVNNMLDDTTRFSISVTITCKVK